MTETQVHCCVFCSLGLGSRSHVTNQPCRQPLKPARLHETAYTSPQYWSSSAYACPHRVLTQNPHPDADREKPSHQGHHQLHPTGIPTTRFNAPLPSSSLSISLLRLQSQTPQCFLQIRHIVGGLRNPRPAHHPLPIKGKRPAHLPPRSAFRWTAPDAFTPPQCHRVVHGPGVVDVPGAACAQAPCRVQLALFVHNNFRLPLAAHLRDPAVCGLLRGVGDSDAVHFGMLRRDGGESPKGLFCDYQMGILVSPGFPRKGRGEGKRKTKYMGSRNVGGKRQWWACRVGAGAWTTRELWNRRQGRRRRPSSAAF